MNQHQIAQDFQTNRKLNQPGFKVVPDLATNGMVISNASGQLKIEVRPILSKPQWEIRFINQCPRDLSKADSVTLSELLKVARFLAAYDDFFALCHTLYSNGRLK